VDYRTDIRRIRSETEPVELLVSNRNLRTINVLDNELKDIQSKEVSGKAVRVIHNGRAGTAPGSIETPLKRLLDTARDLSKHTRCVSFTLPEGNGKTQQIYHGDPLVPNTDIRIARQLAEQLLTRLQTDLPGWSVSGGVTVGKAANHLVSSRGIDQYFEETACDFYVIVSLPKEGDLLEIVGGRSVYPDSDVFDSFVNDIVWRARQAEKITTFDAGTCQLLLHPEALESILTAFNHAIDGRAVFEGVSPLGDSIGKRIFDSRITITDHPKDKTLSGYTPFGDEGVTPERLTLVENGVLKSFLTNLDYAARLKLPHTGHGSRFPGTLDEARPAGAASIEETSTVINAGDTRFEDMIKSVTNGIFLIATWDVWSGNVVSGEISGSTHLAFRIHNGKLVGRIKDMRFSGNIYSMLGNQLAAVSKERPQTSACALQAPYMLLDRVTIT
jgi:PmbA protein